MSPQRKTVGHLAQLQQESAVLPFTAQSDENCSNRKLKGTSSLLVLGELGPPLQAPPTTGGLRSLRRQ